MESKDEILMLSIRENQGFQDLLGILGQTPLESMGQLEEELRDIAALLSGGNIDSFPVQAAIYGAFLEGRIKDGEIVSSGAIDYGFVPNSGSLVSNRGKALLALNKGYQVFLDSGETNVGEYIDGEKSVILFDRLEPMILGINLTQIYFLSLERDSGGRVDFIRDALKFWGQSYLQD